MTWGAGNFGGESSAVREQLCDVEQIQATKAAFAAIRKDGSVVTWGDGRLGGSSSSVQADLKDVQGIQATFGAFAAIRSDGAVVTWGSTFHGGESRRVLEQLRPMGPGGSAPVAPKKRRCPFGQRSDDDQENRLPHPFVCLYFYMHTNTYYADDTCILYVMYCILSYMAYFIIMCHEREAGRQTPRKRKRARERGRVGAQEGSCWKTRLVV